MDKILRIDVGAAGGPKARIEPIGEYIGLGGRALITSVVCKEVPPDCHPLGPENKLVIAPGLMSGTAAMSSGRLSVGCKCPLTSTIKTANAGGTAAQALGRLGYAAVIIEGERRGTGLHMVVVDGSRVRIEKADDFRMLPNYDLAEKIRVRFGNKVSLISIGTAGEMRMSISTIAVTDVAFRPTCHAERGGVGAVMGSKGIKAIVVNDEGMKTRQPANPDKFREANRKFVEGLKGHVMTGQGWPSHGAIIMPNVLNEAGGNLPYNLKESHYKHADKASGEVKADPETKRNSQGSRTCANQRSGVSQYRDGQYVTKRPEYETIWAHNGNCGIHDLDSIAKLGFQEDNYGFDILEMSRTIGVAMEAGLIRFGDADAAMKLVEEAGRGTPLGRILGAGAAVMATCFGRKCAPMSKEQSMPVYDQRTFNSIGMTCAATVVLDPMGSGMCIKILARPELFQAMIDSINAMHGLKISAHDIVELGKNILGMERRFNEQAGSAKGHDRQSRDFNRKPLASHDIAYDVSDRELDSAYNF